MSNILRKTSIHSFNTISRRTLFLFSPPRVIELEDVEPMLQGRHSTTNGYHLAHATHITDVFPHKFTVQQLKLSIDRCQTFSAILDCAQQRLSDVPRSFFPAHPPIA